MADKSKTIKDASDSELDELIVRLRKENETQRLIADLKRNSGKSFTSYDDPQVSTEEPINSLYHYGILGMKWGVRRGQNGRGISLGRKAKAPLTNSSEDHKKKVKLKGKKLHEMSNAELRDLTTRLQLEKQYKDLTKPEVSKGQKIVTEMLTNVAKQTVSSYVSKSSAKMAEKLVNRATS